MNKEGYFIFVSQLPEWRKPGWIENTMIRVKAKAAGNPVPGEPNYNRLRRWENELQQEGRMFNGKIAGRNYSINPEKRNFFPGIIRQI